MPQTFERLIVQVDVGEFHFAARQGIGIDSKIMVVRRDLDLAGTQLLHRMVAAMMSELQFERLATKRNAGELMSQANAENRLPSHQPANRIHRIGTGLGIAGTIRE